MDGVRRVDCLPASVFAWLRAGARALGARERFERDITEPSDLGPASRVTQGKPGRLFETISGLTQI